MKEQEKWKDFEGGYQVSDRGDFRRAAYVGVKGRLISPKVLSRVGSNIRLCINGELTHISKIQVVAKLFLDNPTNADKAVKLDMWDPSYGVANIRWKDGLCVDCKEPTGSPESRFCESCYVSNYYNEQKTPDDGSIVLECGVCKLLRHSEYFVWSQREGRRCGICNFCKCPGSLEAFAENYVGVTKMSKAPAGTQYCLGCDKLKLPKAFGRNRNTCRRCCNKQSRLSNRKQEVRERTDTTDKCCKQCGEVKTFNNFHYDKRADYIFTKCNKCRNSNINRELVKLSQSKSCKLLSDSYIRNKLGSAASNEAVEAKRRSLLAKRLASNKVYCRVCFNWVTDTDEKVSCICDICKKAKRKDADALYSIIHAKAKAAKLKEEVATLSENYVKKRVQKLTGLPLKEIPAYMVEQHRVCIEILREAQKQTGKKGLR